MSEHETRKDQPPPLQTDKEWAQQMINAIVDIKNTIDSGLYMHAHDNRVSHEYLMLAKSDFTKAFLLWTNAFGGLLLGDESYGAYKLNPEGDIDPIH